jgi:hypothetical protein
MAEAGALALIKVVLETLENPLIQIKDGDIFYIYPIEEMFGRSDEFTAGYLSVAPLDSSLANPSSNGPPGPFRSD